MYICVRDNNMKTLIYVKDADSFIKKSKLVWGGDTLDYSKVEYVDAKTPVILICKKCNTEYSQLPPNHWRTVGCPQCFKNAVSKQHKGKVLSEEQKKAHSQNMSEKWKSAKYREQMNEFSNSRINRKHQCRFCGTTENLIPKRHIKKGTSKEEILYRNVCYVCNNARKKKGICKHCGTIENLMIRSVMNQHLKKPKISTQDVCKNCFADLTRKNQIGKKRTEETKERIKNVVIEWHKSEIGKKKHSEGQKKRYTNPEQRKYASERGKLVWKKEGFLELKKEELYELWKDSSFKKKKSKEMHDKLVSLWKDQEYREKMNKIVHDYWDDENNRKSASERQKKDLMSRDRFSSAGLPLASKPQVELYKIAKMFFPDARDDMNIETSISRRYPDIVIPSLSLIVEYDGSYWHSEEEDAKRDKELNNVGYSIIHFIDKVPSMLTFFGCIRQAIILKESVLRVS